jgi:hypothetical protein
MQQQLRRTFSGVMCFSIYTQHLHPARGDCPRLLVCDDIPAAVKCASVSRWACRKRTRLACGLKWRLSRGEKKCSDCQRIVADKRRSYAALLNTRCNTQRRVYVLRVRDPQDIIDHSVFYQYHKRRPVRFWLPGDQLQLPWQTRRARSKPGIFQMARRGRKRPGIVAHDQQPLAFDPTNPLLLQRITAIKGCVLRESLFIE